MADISIEDYKKEIEVRNKQADDIGWLVLQMERLGYSVQIRGKRVRVKKA